MIGWSIVAAVCALAVLAGALRVRAVLPACSAAVSLAAAVLAPPVVAIASAAVSAALLGLGSWVWRLLDEES